MVKFSTISLLLCDFWIFRAAQSEVSRLEVRLFRGYTTGHLIGPVVADCIPKGEFYKILPYYGARSWDIEGNWCYNWLLNTRHLSAFVDHEQARYMTQEHNYCRIVKKMSMSQPGCFAGVYDKASGRELRKQLACFPICEETEQLCEGSAFSNRPIMKKQDDNLHKLFESWLAKRASSQSDNFSSPRNGRVTDRLFPNRTVFGRQCGAWQPVLNHFEIHNKQKPHISNAMRARIAVETYKPFSQCIHIREMHPWDPVYGRNMTDWPFSTFCYVFDHDNNHVHVEHCLQNCQDTEMEVKDCISRFQFDTFENRAYTGTRTHTISGHDCLQWSLVDIPGQRKIFEYGSINSCQCPKNTTMGSCEYGPWCYIEVESGRNETRIKWEPCFVTCEAQTFAERFDCFTPDRLPMIQGSLSNRFFDRLGRHCHLWDTVAPSLLGPNAIKFADMENSNYCRWGYTNSPLPSCFVNDQNGETVESPCIAECSLKNSSEMICVNETNRYTYVTLKRISVDNLQCIRWDYQLSEFRHLENLCANPDESDEGPWCFALETRTQTVIRQSCYPPCMDYEEWVEEPICQEPDRLMVDYAGRQEKNAYGLPCLPWAKMENATKTMPQRQTLKQSFCRNPDFSSIGPWCYVNKVGKPVKSRCFLSCRDHMMKCTEEQTRAMVRYEGRRNISVFGLACQNWGFELMRFDDDNFCQNPDFDPLGPYCNVKVGRFASVRQPCFKFCDDYDEDEDDEERRLYHKERKMRKTRITDIPGPVQKVQIHELTRSYKKKPHHLNRETRQLDIRTYGKKDQLTVTIENFVYGVLCRGLVVFDLILLACYVKREKFWRWYHQATGKFWRCWARCKGTQKEYNNELIHGAENDEDNEEEDE